MTDQEKREIMERLACQCYVDHDDSYVWGTLDEADREPYLKQAEYWTRLLRYFELRGWPTRRCGSAEDVLGGAVK